jgi:hypothetical protein
MIQRRRANSDFLRDCRDWGRRRFGSPATLRRGRVACAAGSGWPGICRGSRHAPGRLRSSRRAMRHIQESAISYVWLFSAAAVASAGDWWRRSPCCPHRRARQKSSGPENVESVPIASFRCCAATTSPYGQDGRQLCSHHRADCHAAWLRSGPAIFRIETPGGGPGPATAFAPSGCTLWQPSQLSSKHGLVSPRRGPT